MTLNAETPYTALSWDDRCWRDTAIIESLAGLHTHLGDGWIADRRDPHAWRPGWDLTGPNGERLRVDAEDGRVAVSPTLPTGVEHWACRRDEIPRKITLSPSKTHAQIARDITRRILADYTRILPGAIAAQRAKDDARHTRDLTVARVRAALAPLGEIREWEHNRDQPSISAGTAWDEQARGSVKVDRMSTGTGLMDTVELRVPRSKLVEVCAAVAAILAADAG